MLGGVDCFKGRLMVGRGVGLDSWEGGGAADGWEGGADGQCTVFSHLNVMFHILLVYCVQ